MVTSPSPSERLAGSIGLAFGALMHLVVGWFHLLGRLVAPTWAWALLLGEWLLLAALLWRLRTRPLLALLVPFASAGLFWAAVTAGEAWLGWTA